MLFTSKKKHIEQKYKQEAILNSQCKNELDAIKKITANISFSTDGIILDANEKFLDVVGYNLEEVIGKHHKVFCDTEYTTSPDYKFFGMVLNPANPSAALSYDSRKINNQSI